MFNIYSYYHLITTLVVDTIRTIKLLGKWSGNRAIGRRRPLIAVFSLTHYCNFYCPMCPFGDSDKNSQIQFAKKNDLSTQQWKSIFDKVSKYCIWSIIEGGEPTSRPDFMELVTYLYKLNIPITLISNCSFLHMIDLNELKKYIEFITCSIDSVFEKSYCKVRGVSSQTFQRVMDNLNLLIEHKVPHYFNSVIQNTILKNLSTNLILIRLKNLDHMQSLLHLLKIDLTLIILFFQTGKQWSKYAKVY